MGNGNGVLIFLNSISLNDLIISNGLEKNCKWLHLDVEGIDSDLILSLDENKINLPEVILYESLNMSDSTKLVTKSFLTTLFKVGLGVFYWHDDIYDYIDRVSKDEGNKTWL